MEVDLEWAVSCRRRYITGVLEKKIKLIKADGLLGEYADKWSV